QIFDQAELGEQVLVDPRAVLVGGPQVVAERLDDVVGGHADVGGTLLDHGEHRPRDASRRSHLTAVVGQVGGEGEVVPEQLVGPIHQVYVHISLLAGAGRRPRTRCRKGGTL